LSDGLFVHQINNLPFTFANLNEILQKALRSNEETTIPFVTWDGVEHQSFQVSIQGLSSCEPNLFARLERLEGTLDLFDLILSARSTQ